MVIDPIARRTDGESVRIARDVLCAGSPDARLCLLEQPREQELARVLAHRAGAGRPVVVVGDDRAVARAVRVLHRRGELAGRALGVVPVGPPRSVLVARGLGVPCDAVRASRTVLNGTARSLDLLEDDSGGVVLDSLGIPSGPPERPAGSGAAGEPRLLWWRRGERAARAGRAGRAAGVPHPLLRVEADDALLADGVRPVEQVSVSADAGLARVVVRHQGEGAVVTAHAKEVRVSGPEPGPGFCYRADAVEFGPARSRVWHVRPDALRLTLPATPLPPTTTIPAPRSGTP
ncbi:diacylglycerol kinase [Streptomyces sp. YIM 98790]|uniref:diacylglycerol kinase n=1 Tax=Streptomyces sp. YIM 98790 TaxID=2689077 RepID=UPI0037DCFFBD